MKSDGLRFYSRVTILALALLLNVGTAQAREIDYDNDEIDIYVTPGEPTQVQFPGVISGGFKRKVSSLSLERKGEDLIVFAGDALTKDPGEAIIVRLQDDRTFSVRIRQSDESNLRDGIVRIRDRRTPFLAAADDDPPHRERRFDYAPPSTVAGLMREMILVSEFGKQSIAGYRASDRYRGEAVINDGTMVATIDRIFIGPNLWGYVVDAKNLIDQTQKINPATFRLDGTRAISAQRWELSPRPLNIEQQVADRHNSKIYIVTRAR